MSQIPYYDSDERLLNFVSDAMAQQYLADGIARAVRRRNGQVVRLYRCVRREPFAIFKMARAAVPTLPHATKNPHPTPDLIGDRPKRVWAPQLRFAQTGHMGKVSTVHLSGGKVNLPATTEVDL